MNIATEISLTFSNNSIYNNKMLTFQYRLFPNNKQQSLLWTHANKLNNLYNYFLDQRITAHKNKVKIAHKEQQAELVVLKKNDKVLQEMHSQVIQQVTLRLKKSYTAFFDRVKKGGPPGFPKFRACRDFFGICYPQSGYTIENSMFITKAYGNISFKQHRNIQGNVKQISISCKNNKYYLNVTTDTSNKQVFAKIAEVGIDIGLKNLVVTSDGKKIINCTHAKYFDKQITKVQSRADKLTKGSNKQKFLSKVKRRLCGAKVRKINDFQHKVSRNLARQYDTVYAEDLSVKNMSESRITNLNKAIRNAKFGQFLNFLGYKANKLVLVNPVHTSMTCNNCSNINHNLKLSDRIITCSKCGAVYDRDENAAKNVFCLGQAVSTGKYGQSLTIDEALAFRRG